jgi:O-antigen/teichoic acid export membrane protein
MIDGTARTFLAEALMVPTGLLTVALLTRSLGPSDYGRYTLAVTIILWLEWGFSAPFARAAVRLVGTAAEWEPMAALVVRVQFAVGALTAIALWLAAPLVAHALDEPALSSLLRLFALDLPLFGVAQAHQQVLVALGRFRERALLSAVRWILRLALIAAVVAWNPASAGWSSLSVHAVVIAVVATTAIEIVLARRFVRPRLFGRSQISFRHVFDYAVPLLLSALCLRVFDRVDVVLLKFFGRSAAEVGMYGAAQNVTLATGLFALSFSPILLSTLAQAIREDDAAHARHIARDAMRIGLLLLPLAAIVAASSRDIVSFVFGVQYVPAAAVLRWLIFAGAAGAAIAIVVAILTGGGRPFWTLFASAPLPFVAIGAHMWAIPRYGPIGAAIVTTLCGFGGALCGTVAVYRLWKVTPPAATAVRSVVVAVATGLAASGWSAPGPLIIIKLAVLGLGVLALLFVSGEFGHPRTRIGQVSRWWQRPLRAAD